MAKNSESALEIKFDSILAKLIESNGGKDARKKICELVGVSQATLSQYLHGKAQPRLPTLVKVAQYFDVDIHYLVFGELPESPPIDLGPFKYIDKSLAGLHAKNDAYVSVVSRITSALAEGIEDAARSAIQEHELSGGAIHDNEIFAVEQYCKEVCLVRLRLDYQYDAEPDGQAYTTMPGGRFLPVIAHNLQHGSKYTYVLPKGICNWKPIADEFRSVLKSLHVKDSVLRKQCRIIVTESPIVAGCVLYNLDMQRLLAERPHLYHQLMLSVVKEKGDSWLGCTLPPSTKFQSNPIMDSFHLAQARKMVEEILSGDLEEI